MSGAKAALDTNVVIDILSNDSRAIAWAHEFPEIYLPVPVLGELRFGALNSARSTENLQRLACLVSRCRILDVRSSTTEPYARLRLDLRKRGRPIPENDLWIAALCLEHRLPLATRDKHFEEIQELRIELPEI
jgi:tRNA(fMet)-specific endonuclease VapC